MAFDINEVVAEMLGVIKDNTGDNWSLVKETANNYLQGRQARLDLLASLRIHNQIDESFYKNRLVDEETILESELFSIAIIKQAIAQKAANAAIDIFEKAVLKAIGIV